MPEGNSTERAVPAPYVLAMVVCDAIWKDPGTGKATLLGLFSTLHVRSLPAVHPVMAVLVELTDGRGKTPIRLRLIDAEETREPLFESEVEIEFADPRAVHSINLHLANIRFEHAGEYRFQLFSGNEPLMERRILVNSISQGEHNAEES